MSYRDDLEALSARHAALEAEVVHKARELEQATRLLEDARARARLPVLDNIKVASPCSADWSQMTGDDRVRHCGDCRKHVYNLSGMTREEAEALILDQEGSLCVRYFQRADGTILLKDDCEAGVARRRRRRRRVAIAGAAALLAGTAGAIGWRSSSTPARAHASEPLEIEPSVRVYLGKYEGVRPQPPEPRAVMGEVRSEPAAPASPAPQKWD